MITQQLIKELYEYHDGQLYRKDSGKKAGYLRKDGYTFVGITNTKVLLHRLIFMMFNGYFPKEVDHINGDRTNSKIENLRGCTSQQNKYNIKMKIDNSSGYKNVYRNKAGNSWAVQIRINGKPKHIGYYKDLELADLVAQEARNKFHKEFACHG